MPGQRIRSRASRQHGPAVLAHAAAAARVALVAVAAAGCGFTADYGGTQFLCEQEPVCPDGFDCIDGVCVEDAPALDAAAPTADAAADAARPSIDAAPPDGAVDFCLAAMDDPASESCAQGVNLTAPAKAAGGVTVYGDTEPLVNDLGTVSSACLSLAMPGRDAIYQVDLAAGDTVTATLVAEWNSAIYFASACVTGATCFAGDTNGTASSEPEVISHTATSAAAYFIVVDNVGPNFGCFQLHVDID